LQSRCYLGQALSSSLHASGGQPPEMLLLPLALE